jgi:hypothetical protein
MALPTVRGRGQLAAPWHFRGTGISRALRNAERTASVPPRAATAGLPRCCDTAPNERRRRRAMYIGGGLLALILIILGLIIVL